MIPIFSAQKANAGVDVKAAINRVVDSHWYILGEEVREFEEEFATYLGLSDCISTANGTDAIELALSSLDVKLGDHVVTVANAGFYASTAIRALGAVPLYVDVDPFTLTMSVPSLLEALKKKPAAIVVTHLYGQLAAIEKVVEYANAAGVPVIEDCAQSHGAARGGKRAGSFGCIGCFSFYPTKNLGALGDGGAVATSNPILASKLRSLKQYGWSQKYIVSNDSGRNSRLDEIQAAILREKLPLLDQWNESRRAIARKYNQAFSDFPLQLPLIIDLEYVGHLYVIRVSNRQKFRDFLHAYGVSTDIHYPVPDHLQPLHKVELDVSLPVTEVASQLVVSLPCFPGMIDADVNAVIDAVKKYFNQ